MFTLKTVALDKDGFEAKRFCLGKFGQIIKSVASLNFGQIWFSQKSPPSISESLRLAELSVQFLGGFSLSAELGKFGQIF